jgi:hypothetical protein
MNAATNSKAGLTLPTILLLALLAALYAATNCSNAASSQPLN